MNSNEDFLKSFSIIIKLTGDLSFLFKYLFEHFSLQSDDELYLINQEIDNVKEILHRGTFRELLASEWDKLLSESDDVYRYIDLPENLSLNPQQINRYYLSLKTSTSKKVLYDFFSTAGNDNYEFWDSMYAWAFTFSLRAYLEFLEKHKYYLTSYIGLGTNDNIVEVQRINVEEHSEKYFSREKDPILFNLNLSEAQIKKLYDLTINSDKTELQIFTQFLNGNGSAKSIEGKLHWKCSNKLIAAMFETFISNRLLKDFKYASNIEKIITLKKSGKPLLSLDIRVAKSQCAEEGYPNEHDSIKAILKVIP